MEAAHDGIDGDCLAQTALFLALAELITTYGEEAAARYAENLGSRIRNGEFSVKLSAVARSGQQMLGFYALRACGGGNRHAVFSICRHAR